MFTTDEEMEELEDRDMTTMIVGYVDAITTPTIPDNKNELLFKFILSNGSKRIQILIWGSTLINKYYKDISFKRIISINGGHCRAVGQTRYREEKHLVPFEILIKENSFVTFLGYHVLEGQTSNEFQRTDFDNIHNFEGLIEISGYIRSPFALVNTRSGLTTYGIGAITNGSKKITIQVKQFLQSTLELGDYVTIKGIVKGQDSIVTIYCDSMNDINLNPEVDQLSPEDIQRGGRPVKRIRGQEKK